MATPAHPPAQSPPPECSVIICAYNGEATIGPCLASLMRCRGPAFEAIVVDNASTDATVQIVQRDYPGVRLLRNARNLGFAGGNNVGLRAARGRRLLLINQDTELRPDWIQRMCAALDADPRRGAVGCKLLYPDGQTIQHAGAILHPNMLTTHQGQGAPDKGQWNDPGPRTYVTAAAIALRREALEAVGLFDEGYDPAYYEEVDLQLRLWEAGWTIWYEPRAVAIHHESQVLGPWSPEKLAMYTRYRFRTLALHGFPRGRKAALKAELRWLWDMTRRGKLRGVLRGYRQALANSRRWRRERDTRPHLARFDIPAADGAQP